MKRILLFDTIIDGHHADYLTHLITYWLQHQPADELVVVTQTSFEPTFQRLLATRADADRSIRFVAIPQATIEVVHRSSPISRSFREWNLLLTYIQTYRPTHALLMYVDTFQLGMWLGWKAPCAVSGIYFRPDFHYGRPAGLKARLNLMRKKATLRGLLGRGVPTNLFCLDHSAIPALQRMSGRVKVVGLPDPVKSYPTEPTETDALRRKLGLELGRRVFLLFGHLDERKGIEPLLEALSILQPTLQTGLCVLLVGAIRPEFRQRIDAKLTSVSPRVQVICVFDEIRGQAVQTYFELADYVLALYQRHVGMASVVVRAAVSGKPLLASDYGYLGQLVQTEQLGLVTDSTAPAAIAQLLERVLTLGLPYSADNLRQLAHANSEVAFAETIFGYL